MKSMKRRTKRVGVDAWESGNDVSTTAVGVSDTVTTNAGSSPTTTSPTLIWSSRGASSAFTHLKTRTHLIRGALEIASTLAFHELRRLFQHHTHSVDSTHTNHTAEVSGSIAAASARHSSFQYHLKLSRQDSINNNVAAGPPR